MSKYLFFFSVYFSLSEADAQQPEDALKFLVFAWRHGKI